MKCNLLRRILVCALAFTTVCSGLGTTVVYAGDVDETAIVYDATEASASDGSTYTEETEETAEPEDLEDSEESKGSEEVEEASAGDTYVADEATEEDSEITDEAAEEDTGITDEAAKEDSGVSDEADEENSGVTDEAAAVDTVSILDSKVAKAAALTQSAGIVTDLSNPEFGYIEKITVPDSISNIGEKIYLGFNFFIKNAETIPDGRFTYTLPDSLDFSAVVGKTIPVSENGVEIGTAIVGSDNVISFQINTDVLEKKPNGLHGSVGLTCVVNSNKTGGDENVKISFSDGTDVEIKVINPVITASKGNVDIQVGKATWKVEFNVSAATDGFVITDELGSNLIFDGDVYFGNIKGEIQDGRVLTINVGHIEKGTYTLRYNVKAVGDLSTAGMSAEEIFKAGNGNVCTWTWTGATGNHSVSGYATQSSAHWLDKYGANMSNPGLISPSGIADWQVYINRGSRPNDISGYTFVDVLDSRMKFSSFNPIIKISYDNKKWANYKQLDSSNFVFEDGTWKIKYTFPETAPIAYYKLFYSTEIVGDLPNTKTPYFNTAYIYKGDVKVAEAKARNVYDYSGKVSAGISKFILDETSDDGVLLDRNEDGIVRWESIFTLEGAKNNYTVTITDKINPNAGNNAINGKQVAAKVLPETVEVYKLDAAYNPVGKALTNVTVTTESANSFKIVAKNLTSGQYGIFYRTQDYYDSVDNHVFPSGSTVRFDNHIEMLVDWTTYKADASYIVESKGLPMKKTASEGYYDSSIKQYVIPWSIVVNQNDFGQANESISAGMDTTIKDYLPDNLEYKKGSANLNTLDGTLISSMEPSGNKELTWTFKWPEGVQGNGNACVISFETVVTKDYFDSLKNQNGGGIVTFSFENSVTGQVGGNAGMTNATSVNSLTLIDKTASLDKKNQLISYSIVINDSSVDLINGYEIKLSDNLTNGTLVAGSLHVYEYANGSKGTEIVLGDGKITTGNKGKSFEIVVPDEKALLIEYQVMADMEEGDNLANGKTSVTVSNKATLFGEGAKSDAVEDKYTFDRVSANITSERGEIKITKVETGNILTGLAGAKFGLYKVDLDTGKETKVSEKDTTAPGYCITFSEDGKYDSLIFDTLYYYQEIKAPNGYKLDDTKHYVVFKARDFESVEAKINAYLNSLQKSVDFKIVDVTSGDSTVEAVVENSKITKIPDDPDKDNDTPEDDTTYTPSEETSVVTLTTTTTTINGSTVTMLDLPEVLGASRNPDDLPEVLGARRSRTEDRGMAGAFGAIILSFIGLAVLLTKRNKESRTSL
ncbi:SpaA isopeptide-forming pilin-related protein [Butyrivibrio sp. VCB2006]|uniref:SpaA isopeptide-forming pilin-related protein n=1 Tax=Butyrivibrio sp. VCB2006 TaxID=1280679 RepID=UPI0003FEDEDE|nr:SpaA isopeptide-forming pilin-related protein [Butyrivibrio sp. VCB2006]